MKKILSALIIFFLCTLNISAHCKFDPEKFRAEIHQFIISSANLTGKEADNFFPLYDEMKAKQQKLHKQLRNYQRSTPTSNAAARNVILKIDDLNFRIKRIEKEYHDRMLKKLPAMKLNTALKAERKFYRQYFRKVAK
ncbi:hypothetical protein ETF27_05065 [Prevotella brunnea]|uniref:Periplasmic heavy metal sensor n=1 Tax=Prevotella brunnea TaxID=2508867 RepID=A0A5C8GJM7_9BACT|nr:hypothetical protein [Prevotella brunnea]MDR0185013.1 hypothetical protein [Prevotella brunnea]TXJ62258.1 hypothetical protein ETF27_05065 [Prevotella brunnea]